MNELLATAGVYKDTVTIPITLEELMFEDPRRLEDLRASGSLSDDQLNYLGRFVEIGDEKSKLIRCHETMTSGCGQVATRVVIPFNDGVPSFGAVRFACASDDCLQKVLKRSKLQSEVFAFSFKGLSDFMVKYPDHLAARKFARLLAKGFGLLVPGAHFNRRGLIAFFGVAEAMANSAVPEGEELAA